jgi:hypothetical protein
MAAIVQRLACHLNWQSPRGLEPGHGVDGVEHRETLHLLPQWASLNKVVLDLLEQYQRRWR